MLARSICGVSLVAVVLVAAACGGGTGAHDGPSTGDDVADAPAGDDGGGDGGGGDAGGGVDAAGDAGGGGPDAGGTGACAAAIAPTTATTMTSVSGINFVEMVTAGGRVFATAPFGVPASTWLRWTGSAWSQEPIPWPANLPSPQGITAVTQLADGTALLVSGLWITTFDGFSMTPAIELPPVANTFWAYTRTSDGAFHVFGTIGTSSGNMHVEAVTDPAGGWYPAAPLPFAASSLDETAVAMANDRIVIAYTNTFFDDEDPVHVHVLSRTPTTNWSAETDITPTWAVHAYRLRMLAPPGGGLLVGASGAGSVIWRSVDGTTFGAYEQASAFGFLTAIHAQCLEHPIIVAGYQTAYRLEARVGGSWTTLKDRTLNYIDDGVGVILPDGKTFLALGETNQHEYFATP